MLVHSFKRKTGKCSKRAFDFMNVSCCILLCVVSIIENNIYGVAAALINVLVNYITTKPVNKRRHSAITIEERINYLQILFVYLAVQAVLVMIVRKTKTVACWENVSKKFKLATINSVVGECYKCCCKIKSYINDVIDEVSAINLEEEDSCDEY